MSSPYVTPIIKIFSTFAEAKEFLKDGGVIFFEDDEKKIEITDLAQGSRNLIMGEPGIGKTELLKKIQEQANRQGDSTAFISLRQSDAERAIDAFLKKKVTSPKVLFLDALDEVQSSLFPKVLEKIVEVSEKYPEVAIYLSVRLVFISKYATYFHGYRFITISPFTERQVSDYLIASGRTQNDVDVLLNRITSFNHRIRVIQVPRYLSFLDKFLKEKGATAASEISRNELFEYFIYSKLESEKKLSPEKRLITKRVLEKLALTMEIYQTNVISEDELMTFFDELKSDLKNAALSQMDLSVFYENSLLKTGQEGLDKIEFENTEFQEYLAAKEISRLSASSRAVFSFAVDLATGEIYPTWFNALTFLVDMQPNLLGQLIEFSGIRASENFKVVDSGFITFLSRIDPRSIPQASRKQLFLDVFSYHQRTLQWMSWELFSMLPGFYDNSIEGVLRKWVEKSEPESGAKRYVPLGNVAYIVKYLFEAGKVVDYQYWRKKLLTYAADGNDNGAMQRRALFALEEVNDPTIIDDLPDLMSSDQLIMRAFLSLCRKLAPNHQKSLEYFIEAVKRDDFYGRYGFLEITTPESLKKFLQAFNSDEIFQREFIKDMSLFQKEDGQIAKHIEAVFDEELGEMSKEALVKCTNINIVHSAEKSSFVIELWKVLKKKYPNFLTEMVDRIRKVPEGKAGLYFALDFFAEVIDKEDVDSLTDAMTDGGETDDVMSLMFKIKFSGRTDAEEIFESGRKKLPNEYKQWEDARAKAETKHTKEQKNHDVELLKEFRVLLEPEPGKFSNGVFGHYVDNQERLKLLLTDQDRQRLKDLITGTIFKFIDPQKLELTITSEHNGSRTYTTDQGVHLFGDALEVACLLEMDLSVYRQQILSYLPFAYDKNMKAIFDLFKDIKPEEIKPVLEVYRERKSDKWRYQLSNFIEACKKYNIVEATPILKEFVKEVKCERYEREQALIVSDVLTPDPLFVKEIFILYKGSANDVERLLSYTANGLLITQYSDEESIQWRLKEILNRAAPFNKTEGVHSVGDFEDEISHSHTFARPLMELKRLEHVQRYLDLLGESIQIWARGKEFHAYGEYLWDIICAYFEGLKESGSFEPLHLLEKKILEIKDCEGANWFAGRVAQIRRTYLSYLGKPQNISEAIAKYNESQNFDNKKIQNSSDLFHHIQDALETDLTRWIEGEGAYEFITNQEKEKGGRKKQYEKLVQITLKPQLKDAFRNRGLELMDIIREPQLLDSKRVDFLIKYGFIGPVLVEVKLTSNSDIKGSEDKIRRSDSYESMKRYMSGYGASHGALVVIDNIGASNINTVKKVFEEIPNVWVKYFECYSLVQKKSIRKASKKSTKKLTKK